MRVIIYADNTLPLPTQTLCDVLNGTCQAVKFAVGQERPHFRRSTISSPDAYEQLSKTIRDECQHHDLALIGTTIPYDNNWFFQGYENKAIVSFSGWQHLTDLPMSNGLAYFATAILVQMLGLGGRHEMGTGCINDFWWDKRAVNFGMRAAFICADCLGTTTLRDEQQGRVVEDVRALLNLISMASRSGKELLLFAADYSSLAAKNFDVFLCHNSADKPAVRRINAMLKAAGINPWLDEEQLKPGLPWQPALEDQIETIRAAAVFVGGTGVGPWQSAEVRAFLSEFVDRQCPVMPVILPDAAQIPKLPLFLKQMTWVDLRNDYEKNVLRLIAALRHH